MAGNGSCRQFRRNSSQYYNIRKAFKTHIYIYLVLIFVTHSQSASTTTTPTTTLPPLTTTMSVQSSTTMGQDSTTSFGPPPGTGPNRRVTIPPLITKEPPKTVYFREFESIELPCEASGQPPPIYSWQMNEKDFDPSGNDGRIAIQPGVGTLIFARPLARDEAIYQCFANNTVNLFDKYNFLHRVFRVFKQYGNY